MQFYNTSAPLPNSRTPGDWKRVSRAYPCPICRKPDWCLFAGPEGDPEAVICARVESAKRVGSPDPVGWLHVLRADDRRPRRRVLSVPTTAAPTALDFGRLAERCVAAANPTALHRFAGELALSVRSLGRLGVGWSARHGAWSFPMRDAGGNVIGIRLRSPGGSKYAVTGSKQGLFVPDDLAEAGRLLIAEGPTDTAALLDLDFAAVGRPSCCGGVAHVCDLVRRLRFPEAVIVADADAPGQRGADNLASVLVAYAPAVRVIAPPAGIKDARKWKRTGATRADMEAVIAAAPVRTLQIRTKRNERPHN